MTNEEQQRRVATTDDEYGDDDGRTRMVVAMAAVATWGRHSRLSPRLPARRAGEPPEFPQPVGEQRRRRRRKRTNHSLYPTPHFYDPLSSSYLDIRRLNCPQPRTPRYRGRRKLAAIAAPRYRGESTVRHRCAFLAGVFYNDKEASRIKLRCQSIIN